jgi:group I intron endonuclease
MESGVYKISFNEGKYFYIGSSQNLAERRFKHLSDLKRKQHVNKKMQNVYDKYKDYDFKVIEYVPTEILITTEQFYLDSLKPNVNILMKAYSTYGYKHSEESIDKLILIANERKNKTEWINKVSKGWFKKGVCNKMSQETINKRVLKFTGYKHSEESKLKMSLKAKNRDYSKLDFTVFNKAGIEASKKPVIQICANTNKETIFESITLAVKQFNTNQTRHLKRAIDENRIYKKSYWRYANANSVNTSL